MIGDDEWPAIKVPPGALIAPNDAGIDLAEQNLEAASNQSITSDDGNTDTPSIHASQSLQLSKARGAAVFLAFLTQGVNDAVPGALLPYIEAHYRVGYAIASLIFVANAVGFLTAAPLVHPIEQRIGRSKSLILAACCPAIAYAIIIAEPPFAVVAICFGLLGFGFSLAQALNNSYLANAPNSTVLLGIMQGGYGVGGTVSPLIGTAIASHGIRWSFFYFVSLGLCVWNAGFMGWTFRNFEPLTVHRLAPTASPAKYRGAALFRRAIRDPITLLGAVFIFAYQGAEVTISGWVVSFLIDYRHGDPAHVGYVTSGFWGGITVGRFALCGIIHKLGDRRCIAGLVLVWAGTQVALWLSRDIIGDAITVAIIGVLSGPIAPCATAVLAKLLNPGIQMIGISIGWSVGSGGAAVAPFLTGLLAKRFGTVVLNPVCIILCAIMELAWFALPGRSWKKG